MGLGLTTRCTQTLMGAQRQGTERNEPGPSKSAMEGGGLEPEYEAWGRGGKSNPEAVPGPGV